MSESPSEMVDSSDSGNERPAKRNGTSRNPLTFFREVVAELSKVVTLTRSELLNYTLVVIVFVLVVMGFVTLLDYAFGQAALRMFGT